MRGVNQWKMTTSAARTAVGVHCPLLATGWLLLLLLLSEHPIEELELRSCICE
jgi:hypothetical protein